jgi:hypothetical protein
MCLAHGVDEVRACFCLDEDLHAEASGGAHIDRWFSLLCDTDPKIYADERSDAAQRS